MKAKAQALLSEVLGHATAAAIDAAIHTAGDFQVRALMAMA
jgi:hypothetical protein